MLAPHVDELKARYGHTKLRRHTFVLVELAWCRLACQPVVIRHGLSAYFPRLHCHTRPAHHGQAHTVFVPIVVNHVSSGRTTIT